MNPRIRMPAIVVGTATVAALLSAPPALAASPDLVISQVYGGGGNSGATYTNDFIELYNRGATTVDVSDWSVQYASAAGSSWQVTRLSGMVAPGARYLVQEAAGAGGTTPLPSPDATGSIAMSGSSGKVALVAAPTALTCGASCHAATGVRDFVGYGSANDFEGAAAAPGLSNTTADVRAGGGATDTDSNSDDFSAAPPSPRGANGGGGDGGGDKVRIHDIQGAAHRSPLNGKTVSAVPGVVTATTGNGFWMQDPQPDDNPATSEAVFVFISSTPTVAKGDAVTVSGRVSEYRPGGSSSANLSTTEISGSSVTVTGHDAALPAPTLVGPGGRTVPAAVRTDAPGDVEKSTTFDVTANALDFYESMEGMLVEIDDSVAVGPTNKYGELPVLPGGAGEPRTARGGILYSYADANPERLTLSSALAPVPTANVGDRLPGAVIGVLDYNFSLWMLDVLAAPTVVPGGIAPETTRAQRWNELAVATYNVENLDPGDPQAKFDRLATNLVHNLAAPDIVAVEEIQDNDGPTDDGVVAADVTWHKLIDAIVAAGGPVYDFRSVDPSNDTDGGEPGGNIRVGFLFRTDRDLNFVDRPGADATTSTQVVRHGNGADLTLSPGRVDPTNAAFDDSRKPLAGEFRFRGQTVFVVANHFDSKGGDDPLLGRFQPPVRPSEVQRHAQAQVVRGFVDQIRAVDANAKVVVLGDLNDFEFSQTADILTGDGFLVDLPRTLPLPERYTYEFEGNAQVLDQILLSAPLAGFGYDYDVVHINSEFADQASDHDPQVVRLDIRPGG